MSKELIVSHSPHETKVAMLEDGQAVEIYVEREKEVGLVGSIYKGRVTRVLPGMQSAFVDIGLERDGFLYVSDFFEGLEEYERILPPEADPAFEEEESAEAGDPETAAPPAPEPEAEEEQPPPPAPVDEDRQPAFLNSEPPLRLPEQRPQGRPRFRGRRRGGRGRGRDRDSNRGEPRRDFRPRSQGPRAPYKPSPAPATPTASEPIILPGESIAKYRDRTASPAAPLSGPAEERAAVLPAEVHAEEPLAETLSPPVEAAETESFETPDKFSTVAPEPENEPAQPAEAAEPPEEGPPRAEETESQQSEPVEEAERPAAPPTEGYPDVMTLAEIQRARQYEDQVGLPPSVQDRVAGGVEWQRQRPAGRRVDRSRSRGGRPPAPRRRERGDRPPGRRPPRPAHARPSRGQPAIAELLRAGQEIIVQIAKEQMGKKGARITSHVTLPGRFLVYMPTIDHIGISRRIGTSEERSRLRRLLLELKGTISGGFVVRTAAAGCSEEDLRQDIDYLVKLWHDNRVRSDESPAPLLLHRDLSLVERLLRDHFSGDYESVWVDSEEEYAKIVEFVSRFQPGLVNRVKLYTKPSPIFEEMGVQKEIDRALRPKVWLKSGGYIVINHTEALVAIDVNTGKFVGKGSTRLEDTIVKTNLEAVKEISRQIRLRDLGGILIIDFIDMEDPRNRMRVMRALEEAQRNDRSPSKLLSFNEFGLVALTRKRSRQPLERLLCQPCPTCVGTGMVKSLETLCFEIQNEARKMAGTIDAPELTIRAHPEIVKSLKGGEHNLVRELEEQTGKNIILQSDIGLHFEEYNIY